MSKQLRELQARKASLVQEARELMQGVEAQGRDMNDEEAAAFDQLKTRIESTSAAIERQTTLIAHEAQLSVSSALGPVVSENHASDPQRGFSHVGEFMLAVYHAAKPGKAPDERLMLGGPEINAAAPSTFGSESSGQDGGFLVPPQYSQEIFQLSLEEDALLPMTDNVEITSNSMAFPKDESTPWGNNGIRAFWQGEAAQANAVKPILGVASLRLKRLTALVPMTDELLDDSNALASYLPKKVAQAMRWKTNEAILFGNGSGIPLGCMNGPAVVTVNKETGQETQTLLPINLAKMIARLPSGSFGRAVWIVNNDVLPALYTLTLGNYPVYLPSSLPVGGIQVSPYGTLLGRPVIVSQHANTFSSVGDVLLADLDHYQTITKAGGPQTDTSMHLYFDVGLTAFRVIFRMDGQSKIANSIAPAKGNARLSPFVQLGER